MSDTRRPESLNLVNPLALSRVVLHVQLFNRLVVCSSIEQSNHTMNNQRYLSRGTDALLQFCPHIRSINHTRVQPMNQYTRRKAT